MAMAPRMAQLTIDAMVPRARLRWQRAFLLVRCRRLVATRLEARADVEEVPCRRESAQAHSLSRRTIRIP